MFSCPFFIMAAYDSAASASQAEYFGPKPICVSKGCGGYRHIICIWRIVPLSFAQMTSGISVLLGMPLCFRIIGLFHTPALSFRKRKCTHRLGFRIFLVPFSQAIFLNPRLQANTISCVPSTAAALLQYLFHIFRYWRRKIEVYPMSRTILNFRG